MLNLKSEKVKTIIVILIFFVAWAWDVGFAYKYGETALDADMASEMVLANKSNQDGVYLDTDWYYSTEIRILGHIMLFKPLLLLFPNNWGLARVVAQAIFLLATGLSYIYMTSVLRNIRKSIFFAAILLCPFSYWHLYHDCFDGLYLIFIICYSLLAGLIFRLAFDAYGGARRYLRWGLMILLSFVCGLHSIRVYLNLLLPLLVAMAIMSYSKFRENDGSIKIKYLKPLLITAVSCIGSAIGYLINHFVLSGIYTYTNQDARQWQDFSFSTIFDVLGYFVQLFGFPYNYINEMEIPLFSKCGMLSCFGILLIFIFGGGFVIGIKKFKSFTEEQKTIFMTAIATIVVCSLIFAFFMPEANGSYFLPSMGLYVASLQIATDVYSYAIKKYGEILALAIIFLTASLSGICNQRLFVKYPSRSHAEMVNVVEALEEQGYTQAVSNFWSGNTITELSDGSIEVWVTYGNNLDNVYEWLQSKSHLTTRPRDKYAYVYEADTYYKDESLQTLWSNNDNACVVYQDDAYVVIGVEE